MVKKTRKHCTELAKTVAKTRDKFTCLRCGASKANGAQIQGSHIKGTGAYPNLSYYTINIKALCASCHRWWHSAPTDSGVWFRKKFPKWYKVIKGLTCLPVGKQDYNKIYESLKEELKALNGGK